MMNSENIEKYNFVYWYSTSVEADLKAAESLHKETYDRLMAKYAREVEMIDKILCGNLRRNK